MFIPSELQALSQFVVWRQQHRPPAKPAKVPYSPWDGRRASVTNPSDWSDLGKARDACDGFDGIGFVFSVADPFAGVDLDGCRDPLTGALAPWAQRIVEQLDSYAEVSPSRRGVKVWLRGAVPGGGRRVGRIELYSERRYFTLTGERLAGTATTVNDRQAALTQLLGGLADDSPTAPHPPVSTTTAGHRLLSAAVVSTGGGGGGDEQAILRKALGAANGEKFARLWRGDTSEYDADQSRADLALCRMLAYWTDRDPALMDALFRRSGLIRPKWDEARGQRTYGQRTIQAALGRW